MNLDDVLAYSVGALRGHALRTGLSTLGVAIGVASVLLLTALGEGARSYVTDQFATLGTNVLIVVPGKTETTGGIPGFGGAPNDLTIADAREIGRRVRGVIDVAPVANGNETVSHAQRSKQVAVIGTTAEMASIHGISMAAGTFLPADDWDRGAPVVVLGSALADELFLAESAVGRVVRIGDFRMRVAGVMASRGVALGVDFDDIALVPVATALRLFNRSSLFRVLVRQAPRADPVHVSESVRALLVERHDGEEDFTLITQDAVMSAFSQIFAALTAALAAIAAISLGVAGVGIMNVMLVSVSERTREIGLLKAVGATSRQVLAVFLTEAVVLSGLGGLAGTAIAYGTLAAVAPVLPIDATPPAWALLAAWGLSLLVGTVFGVLPARRATRLDPVVALRG